MGACQGAWGRVSQCVPVATISPCIKRGSSRASASVCLLRMTSSAQLIRHVHRPFPKTDHDIIGVSYGDILMMQAISVDDTYINLKGVMCVSCSGDVGGFG